MQTIGQQWGKQEERVWRSIGKAMGEPFEKLRESIGNNRDTKTKPNEKIGKQQENQKENHRKTIGKP